MNQHLLMSPLQVFCAASGYTIAPSRRAGYTIAPSRRDFLKRASTAAVVLVPGSAFASPEAVSVCKGGAKNCEQGKLKPPNAMKKSDMAAAVEKVLASYPQSGLEKSDQGGNKFVTNDLSSSGYCKMEFYSGIGKVSGGARSGGG